MNRSTRLALSGLAFASILASACGSASGPRKIIVSETVCGNVRFLKMNLNETNRLILDNTKHSDTQGGMNLTLQKFPVAVIGDVPPNSTIGAPYSTIRLHAEPGQQSEVSLQPTFTGNYTALCQIVQIQQGGSGRQIIEKDLQFRLQ
jgi:hypothetical protein